MCPLCKKSLYSLIFIFSLAAGTDSLAQESTPVNSAGDTLYFTCLDSLYTIIYGRLEQPGGDTASSYIIEYVEARCGSNYPCLRLMYREILKFLWHRAAFSAGIPIVEEEARLAELYDNLEDLIHANEGLSGFHFWADQPHEMYKSLERLVVLYDKAGMDHKVIETKFSIIDGKVWRLGEKKALKELFNLLDEAIELGHVLTIARIRHKLLGLGQEMDSIELVREQLDELEKMPFSDPVIHPEYSIVYKMKRARADLLRQEGKTAEAKTLYLRALDIARKFRDVPRQIDVFHKLARMEWENQNVPKAKACIDTAFMLASERQFNAKLIENYRIKTEIAEAENRFEDAYRFLQSKYKHEAAIDSASAKFHPENYYLELEKKQLVSEKEKQALSLKLRSDQLKYTIAILVLALFLIAGVTYAFFRQRKIKQRITAQHALIEQQAEELRQLDAAKSRFFANVSHELRTPLSLIAGPVHTLLKGNATPEKQKKLLHMVRRGVKDLRHLIDEILDLGKMEAGKMTVSMEPTPVVPFFRRYFSQFESLADQNGVDYHFNIDVKEDVTIRLDREKFRQILFNLLSNAFKFTPAGGRIQADMQLVNGQLRLEITDTGKGIHPDELPHVFDRYFQSNRPDAVASGGTGIGLAICREYAHLLGGTIEVQSNFGKNTRFKVSIPVGKAGKPGDGENFEALHEAEELQMTGGMAPAGTMSDRILPAVGGVARPLLLVVEDTLDLQAYLRAVLEDSYRVVTARNGREALDLLWGRIKTPHTSDESESAFPVDLVISDLMMPEMDGYQLLKELKSKELTRSVPVIMLTARADRDDRLKALRIGVDDYLTKPFDEEELLVRIENLLANQAVRKEATVEDQPAAEVPEMSQPDQEWLEKFETYIRDNLSNDALSISFIAQEFAMSESTLFRQVTRLTGLSPKQYLQEVRLDTARRLLENRAHRTITRVAAEAGFSNARTFSRNFSQRFGKSPGEYLGE